MPKLLMHSQITAPFMGRRRKDPASPLSSPFQNLPPMSHPAAEQKFEAREVINSFRKFPRVPTIRIQKSEHKSASIIIMEKEGGC